MGNVPKRRWDVNSARQRAQPEGGGLRPGPANFLRRLALPRNIALWTLSTLREKLIKIGAKVIRHARSITFQLAEVAVPRKLFEAILQQIYRLRILPETG